MTEWAVTSSVLIIVVLILRQCLKGRVSLRLQYGLWALVLVRLFLPVSLGHTPVSVLNAVDPITSTQTVEREVQHFPGNVTTTLSPVEAPVNQEVNAPESGDETLDTPFSPAPVLHGVWLAGAVAVALWLAAVVSSRDGELCCDEATVARLGEGERASYGRTLLAVTCQGRSNLLLTATSMTGRGRDIKERILLLAKQPKTAALTLAAVVLVAVVAAGCTFTGAAPIDTPDPAPSQNTPQFLSEEEIRRYEELFDPIQFRDDGTQVSNPLCSFLFTTYDHPENLNLERFLRYFPDDGVVDVDKNTPELQALRAHPLWPYGSVTFISQPIHRYTRETVDQILEQYAGITSEDLTGVGADELIYLEEYDAWYNFTSDFAAGTMSCDYGTRNGNRVTLYSTPGENGSRYVLELEELQDGFHILSYLYKEN